MTVVKRLLLAGAIALGAAAIGFIGTGVASAGTNGGSVFIQQSPSSTTGNQQQTPGQQAPPGHCDHDGGSSSDTQNQQSGFLRG
jgi:hypothetical protein